MEDLHAALGYGKFSPRQVLQKLAPDQVPAEALPEIPASAPHAHTGLAGDGANLQLEILDDGVGLPPPHQRGPGMGLGIMSHRAASIGGNLSVKDRSGGGTRVRCELAAKTTV